MTFLRAAMSFFSPMSRMELERASARMVVSSERRLRLLMPPLASPAELGVRRLRLLELLLRLLELDDVLRLEEEVPLRLLEEVREEEPRPPEVPPPPPMRELRVPESSSASAYSRLMTSKMVSGSTMTSSTSIIFSKKGKFSV